MSVSPAGVVEVDQRLCLALYRASHAMTSRYREVLDPLGLTYPQYCVLSILWQAGPSTVGGLAGRLGVESSTLSPLLKRLEESGLVSRRRGDDDERVVVVRLTAAGQRMRRRDATIQNAICEATALDDRQRAALVITLNKLVESLN